MSGSVDGRRPGSDDEKVLNTMQMLVIVTILGAASWVGIIAAIRWAL